MIQCLGWGKNQNPQLILKNKNILKKPKKMAWRSDLILSRQLWLAISSKLLGRFSPAFAQTLTKWVFRRANTAIWIDASFFGILAQKKLGFFLGWFFIKKVASEEVHHIGLGAQNLRWSRAFLWSKSMPILVPIKWVVFEKFRFELKKCCILGFFWPFFGYLGGFISEKFALVTYFRYGLLSHSILGATPRNGTKKICLV